jgi:hypothetical protein
MVSDSDPDLRSVVNLRVTEVVENELLVGTEDWESMFAKLDTLLKG